MSAVEVAAVVLRDERGRVLTVRKRHTGKFMLPGGKPEPGESMRAAAVRECHEELCVTLSDALLTDLGTFSVAAANEPGGIIRATVFAHPIVAVSEPAAEIDEVRWLDLTSVLPSDLAPLLVEQVIPVLTAASRS